jgi:hypothetical protein
MRLYLSPEIILFALCVSPNEVSPTFVVRKKNNNRTTKSMEKRKENRIEKRE